jgi:predicted Ser/Thr protein kinase
VTPPVVSPSDQAQLDSWVRDFEAGWRDGLLKEAVGRLPPAGDPLRLAALTELVRIDLRRQWALGRRPRVEGYLHAYPELGTSATVAAALVFAEYEARRQQGDPTDTTDYDRRFPRQAEQLRALMLLHPSIRENVPTVPPPQPETVNDVPRPTPTALPQQLGRYRILNRLGQGGMGTVYLARDEQLEREVALKVPRFADDDPAVLDRFYQEVKAAARLDHPNICPVYEAGCADGAHYMTMAYVEGRPLAELVRGGWPGDPRRAALFIARLARVLHYAHQKGVVHRDLKPANVMINVRDEPVVMDFGLARRVGADGARLTADGAVMGTPSYMAPEQARGQREAMGPGCDVYSLGVMLYELLAGRLPFAGNQAEVLGHVLHSEPAPPSDYRPGLDPGLEALCLAAMAKDPARRPPTAEALADALTAWAESVPLPVAVPAGAHVARTISDTPLVADRPPRRARRRLVGWGVAALVVLPIAAAAGLFGLSRLANRGEPATGVEAKPPAPPGPAVALGYKRYPDVNKPVRVVREVTAVIRGQPVSLAPAGGEVKPGDKPADKAGEMVTKVERAETYTETILEMADGRPSVYRRVYERCYSVVNGESKEPSYSRRTLLFEELGPDNPERVRITVEGGSRPEDKRERTPAEWQDLLTAEDRQALQAETYLAGDFFGVLALPKDAVAGDGWEVRVHEPLGSRPRPDDVGAEDSDEVVPFDFFSVPGKRTVTLREVVKKEGRQVGVLELTPTGGPMSFTVGGPNAGAGLGGALGLGGFGGLGGLGGGAPGAGGGAGLIGFGGMPPGGLVAPTAPPLGSLKTVEEKVTLEFPIDEPSTHLKVSSVEKTTAAVSGSVVFRSETVRRYERSAE